VTEAQYWDRRAGSYAKHWAPVAEVAGRALLDRLASEAAGTAEMRNVLDLGTGSGVVAIDVVRRWPTLHCVGVDLSPVMLDHARSAAVMLDPVESARLEWVAASAEQLPFDAESFDAAVSAFLYQFLVDRRAMLAEVRRVLRPDGIFAFVTWQAGGGGRFAPDDIVGEVLKHEGIEGADNGGPPSRRPPSPRAVAAELRRSGFERVAARAVTLTWRTDADSYVRRLEEDDLPLTFEGMDSRTRQRVRERIGERLSHIESDAFEDRAQLVSVIARSR
jgi:SAM-dependent methyltransferase